MEWLGTAGSEVRFRADTRANVCSILQAVPCSHRKLTYSNSISSSISLCGWALQKDFYIHHQNAFFTHYVPRLQMKSSLCTNKDGRGTLQPLYPITLQRLFSIPASTVH